jgi:tetratricopeptide (TPR) repeat protein
MAIERRKSNALPRRVLLVGWDAADWQMIHPLVERGLMPTTAALLQQGAWGNLATTRPILSPLLWNTIATGKRPAEHGVLGFTEPNSDGTGVRPTSSTSRKCKALWNILTQCGLWSNVVGWYASHPAEPITGIMVSNQFEQFTVAEGQAPPLPGGCVHPPELAAELADLRVLPEEIDASALIPFVPIAGRLVATGDTQRLGKLQHMLAQTSTVHAVATHLMAYGEWDFTAVYFEGIDRFGHEFMEFHPPKMAEVSDDDFATYQHCMSGIYRFHDMLLETLLSLAGEETAVILMSDHGYYNDHLRPDPREGKSGPMDWHRPFGILAGRGPGFRPGARLYGASILDVAPTVLHLLGLPVAHDMPGRVLAEVLAETAATPRVESWEDIDGPCGMHPPELRIDPAESHAILMQLAALGYVDAPGEDAERTVRDTIAGNQFCLAQSLADARRFDEAIQAIDALDDRVRHGGSAQVLQASCLLALGRYEPAREILERLAATNPADPRMEMLLGAIDLAQGRTAEALVHLEHVEAAEPRLPDLHNKLGEAYLATARHAAAITAFERALTIDPDSPVAYAGLARTKLEMGDAQGALDDALVAAELVHYFPRVHLTIGKALLALGDDAGAVEALELCLRQAPRLKAALESLATAYRNLGRSDKAMAAELRAKGIVGAR